MLQTLLAVSAVVPSILLVWYFHARDVYPEPPGVIWRTFVLGIVTVIPVLAVGVPVHMGIAKIGTPVLASVLEALCVAALPEEFFKLTVLVWFSMRRQEFDEPMDGIVYGVVASLGFATFENLVYVMDGGTSVAFSRAFSAVPFHAFLGAIMGYYVGQAWKFPGKRRALILQGYVTAVVLHGLYDFPLMTMSALGNEGPTFLLGCWTLAVLCCTAWWALKLTRGLRREQLQSRAGQMPPTDQSALPGLAPRHRVAPILEIALGVISASLGGMIALGLVLAFILGIVSADDRMDVLLGGAIIGLLPLLTGGLLFRFGVRGLNRNPGLASQ